MNLKLRAVVKSMPVLASVPAAVCLVKRGNTVEATREASVHHDKRLPARGSQIKNRS